MKTRVHSARVTVDVARTEIERNPDQTVKTWRSLPDGTKSATIELWIDLDSLARDLGKRALYNKAGKSSLAGGDIEAVVTGKIERVKP